MDVRSRLVIFVFAASTAAAQAQVTSFAEARALMDVQIPAIGPAARAQILVTCEDFNSVLAQLNLTNARLVTLEAAYQTVITNEPVVLGAFDQARVAVEAIPFSVPTEITQARPIAVGGTVALSALQNAENAEIADLAAVDTALPEIVLAQSELASATNILQNMPSSADPERTDCFNAVQNFITAVDRYPNGHTRVSTAAQAELFEIREVIRGATSVAAMGQMIDATGVSVPNDVTLLNALQASDFSGNPMTPTIFGGGGGISPP